MPRYKELTPIRDAPEDYDAIEKEILSIFRDEIYFPLFDVVNGRKILKNSLDDLLNAIRTGKITYSDGAFSGRLSSSLSRELKKIGAKWAKGEWRLPASKIPIAVRAEINVSEDAFKKVLEKLDKRLSDIIPNEVAQRAKLSKLFDTFLFKREKSLQASMKGIVVTPKLSKEDSKALADGYSEALYIPIKDFITERTKELRKTIQAKVFKGNRIEELAKTLQEDYGVSCRKAKFLARQETNLLLSKFKEVRYASSGITKYRWQCAKGFPKSGPHAVRPMHWMHNGKVFSFSNPPIANKKGDRLNPGEDFGCRCLAKPLVQF